MFSDLKYIFLWWFVIFALGWITLPLIFHLFRNFFDRGYIFTKIFSLALLTYSLFVFSVFKLVPFSSATIFIFAMLIAIIIYGWSFRTNRWEDCKKFIASNLKIIIFEEVIFFLILAIWSYVRGFAPDIEGLEKFMDWGFVNSTLRSTYLPPADMWFAGQPINYYYFGHLIFALITKLSSIPSAITYNLSIATACAFTFTSAFSFTSNLAYLYLKDAKKLGVTKYLVAGIFSAFLVTFGGNLHPVYKIAKIDIQTNGHLVLTQKALAAAASLYWYPDATRFIGFDPDIKDKTIHEFPIYSFVVADLHGHMNDIAMVVFIMAVILSFLSTFNPSKSDSSLFYWPLILPLSFCLSVAYMTNAWDFAVYGLLFAISAFVFLWWKTGFINAFLKMLINGLTTVFLWYVFTIPYSLNFTPMAQGLRLADSHSAFYQLFILYGGFWLITLPLPLFLLISKLRTKKFKLVTSDLFALGLLLTATILIILPELGYIKDIYIYEHRRANTMFKLVYEAFIIYSLVSGYAFVRLGTSLKSFWLWLYRGLFFIIFIVQLIYPYFAIKSYYGLGSKDYQGLTGLNWLKTRYPANYDAVNWLNDHITGQPVILEAVGDSYTDYNQISVATGLPTVEGWIVHEWLWRGGYDQPAARQTDVEKIYESTDVNEVRSLLQKYDVSYVFVGDMEYTKYPNLNEDNFTKLGAQIVFSTGKTKIYKVAP